MSTLESYFKFELFKAAALHTLPALTSDRKPQQWDKMEEPK